MKTTKRYVLELDEDEAARLWALARYADENLSADVAQPVYGHSISQLRHMAQEIGTHLDGEE